MYGKKKNQFKFSTKIYNHPRCKLEFAFSLLHSLPSEDSIFRSYAAVTHFLVSSCHCEFIHNNHTTFGVFLQKRHNVLCVCHMGNLNSVQIQKYYKLFTILHVVFCLQKVRATQPQVGICLEYFMLY